MVMGEFNELLVTVTRPVTLAATAGANSTLNVAVCPGDRVMPERPRALNPAPATLTYEIVTLDFPALVSRTLRQLLLETVTLPNATFVELLFRR